MPEFDCYVAFAKDFQIRVKNFGTTDILKSKIHQFLNTKEVYFKIAANRRYSYPIYKTPPVFEVLTDKKVTITHFDYIVEMAYYIQYTAELPFTSEKKLVGLYTDSFPHEGPSFDGKRNINLKSLNREMFYNNYLKPYDGVVVGNMNLYNDYAPLTSKLVFANGIYLQNQFVGNLNVGNKETLTIAWTGTPDRPMKGFRSVIEPAIEAVQKTGRKINLKTKFSGNYEELLTFYKDVDLVAIASEADTGPSLFAEASLSNVPSISTEIGFPKMVIKHQENGIFINRNVEDMTQAIIDLYDHREKLIQFSRRIKRDYLAVLSNDISIENLKNYLNQL